MWIAISYGFQAFAVLNTIFVWWLVWYSEYHWLPIACAVFVTGMSAYTFSKGRELREIEREIQEIKRRTARLENLRRGLDD